MIRRPPRSTLFLHDALPISHENAVLRRLQPRRLHRRRPALPRLAVPVRRGRADRSEEHTSELQSLTNLVCRLLLEKKNYATQATSSVPSDWSQRNNQEHIRC